jgi:hypothetical protein
MMTHADSIRPRDLSFAIPPDLPRYWHGGRRSVTLFLNNLSVFFPEGERFFIASVKAHAACVAGRPEEEAVRRFGQQEGYHSREHSRYNQVLAAQGYPVAAMEARVSRLLRRVRRRAPLRRQLAITCALEHFTALLAQIFLSDPRLLDGAHPEMAALWRWHAVEELEHKAVAFDVYKAAGGPYLERVLVMLVVTVIFWAKVIEQQARMMAADGLFATVREWAALLRFLFIKPGGLQKLARPYLAYFHPRFHPSDLDHSHLVAPWREALT